MARFARVKVALDTASNASYAGSIAHVAEKEFSYEEGMVSIDINVETGGSNIDPSFLGSRIGALLFENLGTYPASYVELAVSGILGTSGITVRVPIAAEGLSLVLCPGLATSFGISMTAVGSGPLTYIPCRVTVLSYL